MSHKFVKGDKYCLGCGYTAKTIASAEPCVSDPSDYGPDGYGSDWGVNVSTSNPPAPAPEPEPQVWHLNVWTNVNGVLFAGSTQISDADPLPGLIEGVVGCVENIHESSTSAPEE